MKKFKALRRTAIAAVAVSSVLALAACSGDGGTDTGGTDIGEGSSGGDVVRVGFIGALTGGSASLNVPAVAGMELAIEHLNASGELDGRTIEIVTADDEADSTKAAQAAERLLSEDDVVAIIGGGNSPTVAASNPIITGGGVVHLISVAQNDPLIDPESAGFPLTFRVTENNAYNVGAIVQLFQDGGYESICAVADTTDYGQSGIETIRTVFDERGLELDDVVTHEVGATDMTPQVLTLRDGGCDAVYLFSLGAEAATFMQAVTNSGWDVPVIGGRGLNQAAFLSIAQGAGDGIIVPSIIDPEKDGVAEFIEAYDEANGDLDPAHVFGALGYDTMMILVEALKGSDWEGGEALAQSLEATDYEGVAGREGARYQFSADDHEGPTENWQTFMRIENNIPVLESRDIESGQ